MYVPTAVSVAALAFAANELRGSFASFAPTPADGRQVAAAGRLVADRTDFPGSKGFGIRPFLGKRFLVANMAIFDAHEDGDS